VFEYIPTILFCYNIIKNIYYFIILDSLKTNKDYVILILHYCIKVFNILYVKLQNVSLFMFTKWTTVLYYWNYKSVGKLGPNKNDS